MKRLFGPAVLLAFGASVPAFAQSSAASGQSRADYRLWHATASNAAAAARFEAYLRRNRVADVVPMHQLLRTASDWRPCRGAPFAVAPDVAWPAIVRTLRLVRDEIRPAIGAVEVLSGYRDPLLNRCSHGAPASAHARFQALDLTPLAIADRDRMIARICRLHARIGPRWAWGLGFYSGLRFHVDTRRYRRWGSDGHSATSPCAVTSRRPVG